MRSLSVGILCGLLTFTFAVSAGPLGLYAVAQPAPESLSRLKKILTTSLAAGDIDNACLAIQRLSELNEKRAVEYLVKVGLRVEKYVDLDEHSKMRIFRAARDTLPKVTDPAARKWLFDKVRSMKRPRDSEKKVFLTEVIGKMEGEDAEETLILLLGQDRFQTVQLEAIEALARQKSVKAVEHFINLFARREGNPGLVWDAVDRGLVEITGYRFPTSADWKNFWAIRKDTFNPDKDRGKEKAKRPRTKEKKVPTFFDEEILAKRLVFIIDISMSMHVKDKPTGGETPKRTGGKPPGGECPVCGKGHRGIGLPDSRMRIERVKRELVKLIDRLDSDRKFNILAFSTDVLSWQGKPELIPATEENKRKAIGFVEGLTFEQYTSTDFALERAFNHREANAFILLSDGTPLRDKVPLPKEPILEMVAMKNKTRKVRIQTFGFSEDADKAFLEKLANQNDGRFVAVK